MIATVVNVVLVLIGSFLGLAFKGKIKPGFIDSLGIAMGLCVLGIGIPSMIGTDDTLCVVACMAVGTLLGEALRIEDRLAGIGDVLKRKMARSGGNDRFTEGFVNATVLFCVGAMAINGSLEAGLNHNYGILISKSVIDGVTSITFASTMGIGVPFCVIPLFLYQGGLTLLAQFVGPYLQDAVIREMSAVGGTIIVAIGMNMMGLPKQKIRVGNMLPAIFLPLLYLPLAQFLGGLLG